MPSMDCKILELRPDRKLLKSNFDGYKLSLEPVAIIKEALQMMPDRVHPSEAQYSFLHLFAAIESILASYYLLPVYLFEYDERFLRQSKNCIFYDYTKGTANETLKDFQNFFDLVIADPPFLSEECISKTADILQSALKQGGKIVLCSGRVVSQWAEKFLQLTPCNFQPKHKRNLGNEFASFANFNFDHFIRKQ
uniref:Protein-lysine N-methyltransferase n=1 Tax=Phlebotomus papatasi TaxID=29031 RepID=A0A1B0GNI9_PHLPP